MERSRPVKTAGGRFLDLFRSIDRKIPIVQQAKTAALNPNLVKSYKKICERGSGKEFSEIFWSFFQVNVFIEISALPLRFSCAKMMVLLACHLVF